MHDSHEGSPSPSPAGVADPPGGEAPDDGLEWLVESGYCSSPAEAESLRNRALEPHEDEADAGGDEPRSGVARWRRWLEIGRPDPDEYAIRAAVEAWRIEALGDHPGYHIQRDLLHASLLRDLRTKAFHGKTKEPEPWVQDRVAHLKPRHRQAAIQHTTLDVMNRRLIGLLWEELEGRLGPPDPGRLGHGADFGLLLALWACPPVGALLRWQGDPRHARDFGDGGCRNGRVCPWCHARQVRDLHDRLARGPCRPGRLRGKCLIRIRARIASGQLVHHNAFAAFARAHAHDVRRGPSHLGAKRFLGPEEVRLVRGFWADTLSDTKGAWGIEGGIVTHQVEPYVDQCLSGAPEHRHELTLVGSFPSSRLGIVRHHAEGMLIEFTHKQAELVSVDVADGANPQALRLLLSGPPYQMSSSAGPLYSNWEDARGPGDRSGALRLMPWFLAGPPQWWSHFQATRGSKLYSTFGTWKEALGRAAGGARRRQAPLDRHNEESRREALARQRKLLVAARPIYAGLSAEMGRKPGHSALREALAHHLGRGVSERDARRLVKEIGVS